jgi:hypothetical protein
MSTRNIRIAIGLAAVIAPVTIASSSALADDTTSAGLFKTLEHVCEGQDGMVTSDSPYQISCANVTPSPYRSTVMQVVDHVCTELLGATLLAGPSFGASDGSVITWSCGPLPDAWRVQY